MPLEPPPRNAKRTATALAIAMAMAAPAEGIRRVAYYDPPGVLTVCRGHTGSDVVKNRVYSMKECDSLFSDDMRKAVEAVDRCRPGLPIKVLAAFADAGYNMGKKIACDTEHSTAARYLAKGKYELACRELPRWNKAQVAGVMVPLPGLTNRRVNIELPVCLEGAAEAVDARVPTNYRIQLGKL